MVLNIKVQFSPQEFNFKTDQDMVDSVVGYSDKVIAEMFKEKLGIEVSVVENEMLTDEQAGLEY